MRPAQQVDAVAVRFGDGARASGVLRTVVDDQDLDRMPGLGERAVNGLSQIVRAVEDGNDNGDEIDRAVCLGCRHVASHA